MAATAQPPLSRKRKLETYARDAGTIEIRSHSNNMALDIREGSGLIYSFLARIPGVAFVKNRINTLTGTASELLVVCKEEYEHTQVATIAGSVKRRSVIPGAWPAEASGRNTSLTSLFLKSLIISLS